MIFDNGGWAGYGLPDRMSKDGSKTDRRDYSRIIELDPTTLEVVWEYTGHAMGGRSMTPLVSNTRFYSQLVSSAQRLPNGNTMITEGCSCRLFEVTADKEVVWEYYAPFDFGNPFIYRAYRYPYSYVPQLDTPEEVPVVQLKNQTFRVPGAAEGMIANVTKVEGTFGYEGAFENCVTEDKDAEFSPM